MVGRFRLQNEERANLTWRKDALCRVCREEPEILIHILRCSGVTSGIEEILDERGTGASEMRRIKQWQKEECKKTSLIVS